MKKLAIILIIIGALLAALVLVRGFYYAPNGDSGLSIGLQETPDSPTVTSSNAALPSRLIIPKLEIDTDVQHVGVTRSGNMAAPNNFTDVSWYKYGTIPGNLGSAVMAGHVDNALGTPAIFIDLPKLEIGDDVYVTDEDGRRLRFQVVDKELYPYDEAPLKRIFNESGAAYLNLITCQGEWVPEAKSAAKRLVVYTKLVE
jgi:sortase A